MNVFGVILELACLSVHVSVRLSLCLSVQNTTFCQSAGGGIKSHSETALVYICVQQNSPCLFFFLSECKKSKML